MGSLSYLCLEGSTGSYCDTCFLSANEWILFLSEVQREISITTQELAMAHLSCQPLCTLCNKVKSFGKARLIQCN